MIRTPLALACAAALSLALPAAHAAVELLPSDGSWAEFTVDDLLAESGDLEWIDIADGSALSFAFTIPTGYVGTLTVVDAGFAGDRFLVTDGNRILGRTSVPGQTYPNAVYDFDEALADSRYSQAVYSMAAGSHEVSGFLIRSAVADDLILNSTNGAVRLTVSAVPEPETWALMLAGVMSVGMLARRRSL